VIGLIIVVLRGAGYKGSYAWKRRRLKGPHAFDAEDASEENRENHAFVHVYLEQTMAGVNRELSKYMLSRGVIALHGRPNPMRYI
jgi:hypothetical protein